MAVLRWTVFLLVATSIAFSFSFTNNNTNNKVIPITVISGFLGSGKTTLLQHLLHNKEGLRIAVIVNDVASVNIDSKLISGGQGIGATAAGMVELQNGCACCSLSDELLASVSELVTLSDLRGDEERFHHIVVELSGVADPKSVRAKFQEAVLYDMPLMERVSLDTLTTVVDCSVFLEHLSSAKGATPKDAPELFYREGEEPNDDEQPDWMEGMPAPLVEALLAGERAYGTAAVSENGVAELLVTQTETADVVLLNKLDLVESETTQRIEQIVRALNPRATVIPTEFGVVSPDKILASAGGKGVVEAGVVDDHRDAVEAAAVMTVSNGEKNHAHDHEHNNVASQIEYSDPDCTDPSHSHTHDHQHSSEACTDPNCTDQTHSHSHSHTVEDCTDPDCTDPTHSHSHTHRHGGIGTYVYRARRPFHPGRLVSFLRHLPVSRGLPKDETEESPCHVSSETEAVLKSVLRSKGFVWCADSNVAALYWSHAGSSFEMQCLGRWWATLPRAQWPAEAAGTILADFDDPNHEEGDSESVGDRRQEVVFIGTNLGDARKQNDICSALDQCLLTDSEWKAFEMNVDKEDNLRSLFANPINSRMASY